MKPIIYMHIGMPKTGTTALQNFFYINRDVLESYGISYPLKDAWYRAHHRLSWSFNIGRENDHPPDLKDSENEWSDILKKSSENKTIISAEILFRCTRDIIHRIRRYTYGYDVKVIVYLRRVDKLYCSILNQLTKYYSDTYTDISRISHEKDFLKNISSWADIFGKENIIVRPYEKGQFYEGSIFSDFLFHVLGLELTDEFQLPERDHNSRLHRIALEYKRCLNFLPMTVEQKRNTVEPLRQYSQTLYSEGRKDFSILSPSQCFEIIQQYAESNEKVAREFLGREDGKLFYEPLPDINKPWKSYPGLLSKGDIRQISLYIAEQDPEFAKQLGRAIQKNLKSDEKEVRTAAKKLYPGLHVLMNKRKALVVLKDYFVQGMRFIYRRMPTRIQPILKKVAYKLKITQLNETDNTII